MTWTRVVGSLIVRPERPPVGPEERRLLDAVIADPDDDGPRLVYADWLISRGDPLLAARGELIVVQCALEQQSDPEQHNRLKARDFELVERHGNLWCTQLGLGPARNNWYPSECEVELRRGFLESVTMPVADYPRVATRLFGNEPVRKLRLTGLAAKVVERLPTSVFLRRLRSLALQLYRGAPVVELVTSEHLANLRVLELLGDADVGNQAGDRAAAAIARAPALGELRELTLSRAGITTPGLYTLVSSPLARQLEVLALDGNLFDDEGAMQLVRSPQLANLRRLTVTRRGLSVETRQRLAERFGPTLTLD